MPVDFQTYLVRPLLMGGTGQVQTAVLVTGDVLERIVVKIGSAVASAWDDPSMATVEVPVGDNPGDGSHLFAAFTKAIASDSAVATWFVRLRDAGWVKGPSVSGIDLTSHYVSVFPWLKTVVLDLLRQGSTENPPELQEGRQLAIRSAFPRDGFALPCLFVQLTAVPTGVQFVGDSDESGSKVSESSKKSRGFNLTVDITACTDTPEEREVIAPWLGGMLGVVSAILPFFGGHEPTFSVNESEDIEGKFGVPMFFVTGSINFSAFSSISVPVPTSYGHLQTIQEVPNV